MIKLYEALPNTIEVQGEAFSIKTDFRYWILFSEIVKNKCTLDDLRYLFVDKMPECDFSQEIVDFYCNPNSTPKGRDSNERLYDYIEDGEYIYASFLAVYGIDLLEVEHLHWHKFKALFLGLPDDSKIKQIMGMRAYKKDNKSIEKQYEENKRAWALPQIYTDEEKELEEEISRLFYNT